MGRYRVGHGVQALQRFVRDRVSQRTKMVAVAGLAALALSNCIVTEGPASFGTDSTDNPSNGVAVANGGTASGTCLLPLGAGCIVPGASASTTGNANTGGSYSALALTGTG